MAETILVAGNQSFSLKVKRKISETTHYLHANTNAHEELNFQRLFNQLKNPLSKASLVFVDSEPNFIPVAHVALKSAKHVVLFGAERCSISQLNEFLELAIESNTIILNGDSLLFNPVVYPMLTYFNSTEITTLVSNRFRKYLSRRSIFQCIEFLLYTNQSPLRSCSAKGIKLSGERLNVLHVRFEFENEAIAVLELTNTKPNSKLYVESAGEGNWMSLDLLSFNGQYYHYSDREDAEVKPPKQVYPKERNSMNHMFHFMDNYLQNHLHAHKQFENVIDTSKAILLIEEQLRRGIPNFVEFGL